MTGQEKLIGSKRTAVLVVHGMGTQRPLETVRGVVEATWLDDVWPSASSHRTLSGAGKGQTTDSPKKKIWVHPERSVIDIDLPVITTSDIPGASSPIRRADFHEFYWSHLMSETRAVAVLLWLFELANKGPRFKGLNELWWVVAIFLELLIFSVTLTVLLALQRFTQATDANLIVLAPVVMFLILGIISTLRFIVQFSWRLTLWSLLISIVLAGLFFSSQYFSSFETYAARLLPSFIVFVVSWQLMGLKWGSCVFALTYGLSMAFEVLRFWIINKTISLSSLVMPAVDQVLPWTLESTWCAVAAWIIIATYLLINAAFLTPYLGDAARYFRNAPSNVAVRREIRRQAVNTLEGLHRSGKYDRIVVVAHSLGTVVAYDMLRNYFGRIARSLPTDLKELGRDFDDVDTSAINYAVEDFNAKKITEEQAREIIAAEEPQLDALRKKGRAIIRKMASIVSAQEAEKSVADSSDGIYRGLQAWLVTDFVTLGSPLTHAHFLMCQGHNSNALEAYFDQRVYERQFLTCPPYRQDADGMLTFAHPLSGKRWCHHGAVFALTRWTNLYFPRRELFWGDAIGGPLALLFGKGVRDVKVSTKSSGRPGFFTHTAYWDVRRQKGRAAPHIVALREAVNLADN